MEMRGKEGGKGRGTRGCCRGAQVLFNGLGYSTGGGGAEGGGAVWMVSTHDGEPL